MLRPSILIVQADEQAALDLQWQIEQLGFDAAGVATLADQALTLASQAQPSLVIMDLKLQDGASGIDTARKLRAQHGLPVVFIAASSDADAIERAAMAEPFGYLTKPVKASDLCAALTIALRRADALSEDQRWFSAALTA